MLLRQSSRWLFKANPSPCRHRTLPLPLPATTTTTTTTTTTIMNNNTHISRNIHRTACLNHPSKDTQDKDSLSPRSTEYSKSQSDDDAGSAGMEKTAFDPSETSPEGQMAMASEESGGGKKDMSPLEASPANKDISKPKSDQEGGPERSASGTGTGTGTARGGQSSGKGSPPKAGGEKSG